MRRCFAAFAGVAIALFATMPAHAQDAPPYTVVQEMELAPGDAEVFAEQVRIVAAAAAEAEIGSDFAWNVYRWDNTFWFVSSQPTLADLEDQEAMARAFRGTSAEARAFAAFEKAGSLTVLSGNTEILQVNPDMGYRPENPAVAADGAGGVMIVEQWVKGGQKPAFDESVKGFMDILAQVDGPYPVLVAEDVVGDGGVSFIVIFDNLSDFFGKNAMETLMAGADIDAAAGAAAHAGLITRAESQLMMRLPDLSYQPGNN